jgi:hypothetical protein
LKKAWQLCTSPWLHEHHQLTAHSAHLHSVQCSS